jgi:hypothetical protein
MFAWSILIIVKSFDIKCLITEYFEYVIIIGYLCFFVFIGNAIFNWNRNSLFFRIIIALVASWLLIAISDDFVASQIFVSEIKLKWIIRLFPIIVVIILFLECREYSPYYLGLRTILKRSFWKNIKRECNIKIMPILSFSIFLSLFIGIIVQFATFESLIKTNNVLPAVHFSTEFANMEKCKSNTQLLINNLEEYRNEIFILGLHQPEANKLLSKDSLLLKHIHNKRIEAIKIVAMDTLISWIDKTGLDSLKAINNWENMAIVNNIKHIDSLLPELNKAIISLNEFNVKYHNTDSLLKVICDSLYSSSLNGTDSLIYGQFLQPKLNLLKKMEISNACIKLSFFDKQFYLFPRTLVFHAFIVLLIAFIVQILVSGKSVTEGL